MQQQQPPPSLARASAAPCCIITKSTRMQVKPPQETQQDKQEPNKRRESQWSTTEAREVELQVPQGVGEGKFSCSPGDIIIPSPTEHCMTILSGKVLHQIMSPARLTLYRGYYKGEPRRTFRGTFCRTRLLIDPFRRHRPPRPR